MFTDSNQLYQQEILLMLYNGVINFCNEAEDALRREDYDIFNEKIKRVQAIINEFMTTVDREEWGERFR